MADPRVAVRRLLDKYEVEAPDDLVREMLATMAQFFVEEEVSAQVGAQRYERSEGRTTHPNGYRDRD